MAEFSSSSRSGRTALGGVMAAGSLLFLWFASVTPSGRLGLTAVAGLFPMAAVLSAGRPAGYLCWAASGLLSFFLLPDKGVALLYLAFLGLYPIVKSRIESLRRLPVEWLLKLAFFDLVLTLFWFFLRSMFLPHPPTWLGDNILLIYLLGNAAFILYDIGLSRLIAALRVRFR